MFVPGSRVGAAVGSTETPIDCPFWVKTMSFAPRLEVVTVWFAVGVSPTSMYGTSRCSVKDANAVAATIGFGSVLPEAVSTSAQELSIGVSVTAVAAVVPFETTQ